MKKSFKDSRQKFFDTCKSYLNVRENIYDFGAITVLSALYDVVSGSIDNPIPNIANGAGSVMGFYVYVNERIKNKSLESSVSTPWFKRCRRGLNRALLAATVSTALRIYINESDSITDYGIDVFANTLRFGLGYVISHAILSSNTNGDGGDDRDDNDEEKPQGPPETPKENPIPYPGLDDRTKFKLPTISNN